ncbi:hypothetical protein HJFPF1_01843 [Paramyrothecium foliicola]|nr:hypothetical protein HJFPF1_01843 [Paramyrothecium foliicola]
MTDVFPILVQTSLPAASSRTDRSATARSVICCVFIPLDRSPTEERSHNRLDDRRDVPKGLALQLVHGLEHVASGMAQEKSFAFDVVDTIRGDDAGHSYRTCSGTEPHILPTILVIG